MAQGYMAEIRTVAFNFAPKGWALCDGQLLSIAANQALFALLGTTYGGNGTTNFVLPDLRGRLPVHRNSFMPLGLSGGLETVTLTPNEMPGHLHMLSSSSAMATSSDPAGGFPAVPNGNQSLYATGAPSGIQMGLVGASGGSQSHDNIQPSLAINFVICLQGIFPSRN